MGHWFDFFGLDVVILMLSVGPDVLMIGFLPNRSVTVFAENYELSEIFSLLFYSTKAAWIIFGF